MLSSSTRQQKGFSKGFRRCPDSNHQRGHSPLQWGRRGGAPRKTGQRWRARLRGAQQVSRRPAGRGGAVRCAAHCPATWARCGPGPAARRAGPSVGPRTDVERAVCAACVRARAASRHGVVDLRHGGRLCGGLQSSRHCASLPACCPRRSVCPRAGRPGWACAPSAGGAASAVQKQCPEAANGRRHCAAQRGQDGALELRMCSPPLPSMLRVARRQLPPRAVGSLQIGPVCVHARARLVGSSALRLRLRLFLGKGGYRLG